MSDKSVLAKTRKQMMISGLSEHEINNENGSATVLFQELQDLRKEMNAAKLKAAEEAGKPFLERIAVVEKRYAMIVKLSAQ